MIHTTRAGAHYIFTGKFWRAHHCGLQNHPGTTRFVFTNFTKTYTTLVQM